MIASLLRELGADVRRFKTVQGAMRWQADARARRLALAAPLEGGSTPRSREARDRDNATYALLCRCLEPQDPAIDRFNLVHVSLFEAWCCAWESQREMARQQGVTLYRLRLLMQFTERILRRRMECRGLLRSEQDERAGEYRA